MPFTSINPTNPRTNPWNFHKKILRIGGAGKRGFLESAILIFFWFFFCFISVKKAAHSYEVSWFLQNLGNEAVRINMHMTVANICTFIELKWVLTLSMSEPLCCGIICLSHGPSIVHIALDVCFSVYYVKSFYFMVFFSLVYLSTVNMGQRTHSSGMNFFLSFCDRLCHSPIW